MTGSVLLTTSSRPLAKFHPNVWGDCFLLNTPQSIQAGEKQIVEELKEDVRRELKEVSNDYLRQLKMVDAIQRLGVEYHFEEEIDEALQNLFKKFKDYCKNKHDMYVTALSFRLLRQHGYRVSCQIFDEFMDDEDGFKVPEVNAVLEFFEATHLRIQGEDVLDQGVVFSRNYLESILPSLSNPVAEQVRHALFGYSNRRALPRVEARKYIPIYEQYASHHQGLLKLAKLDFNMLQSMHRRELSEISRWWKGLEVATKLPFVRDRLVETYFWDAGVYFEPQYAVARMILTKVQYLLSIIDDISDAYATLEELQIFADAIQRWEEKYKPKSQEYMLVATESSGYITVTIISLLGMRKDVATREVFDWVVSRPHVMRALLAMCRLNDDIAGHEFEQKREHIPSAVECYSEEHNVSKEEAVYEFKSRIECAWKDINEAFLRPTKFPTTILYRILNLARAMEVLYSKGDWYTNVGPEMQTLINHLYIHPLS